VCTRFTVTFQAGPLGLSIKVFTGPIAQEAGQTVQEQNPAFFVTGATGQSAAQGVLQGDRIVRVGTDVPDASLGHGSIVGMVGKLSRPFEMEMERFEGWLDPKVL
jgi:hypothetical protein